MDELMHTAQLPVLACPSLGPQYGRTQRLTSVLEVWSIHMDLTTGHQSPPNKAEATASRLLIFQLKKKKGLG